MANFDVLVRTRGEAEIAALKDQIAALKTTIIEADHAYVTNMMTLARHAQVTNTAAAAIVNANQRIRDLGSTTRNMGQAMLQASYAIDDLQYGLQGVLNNVPGIVMSLGGSAGLAGAISMVAVAANTLYNHWDELMGALGQGKTQSEADQMKELAKATDLTADSVEKLYRFEQLRAKAKSLTTEKTVGEKKSEELATAAIVEADQKHVVAGILKNAPGVLDNSDEVQRVKRQIAKDAFKNRALVASRGMGPVSSDLEKEAAEEAKRKNGEKLVEARRQAALRMAAAGTLPQLFPKAPGGLSDLIKKNPGDFGPNHRFLTEGLDRAQAERDKTPADRESKAHQEAIDKMSEHDNKETEREMTRRQKEEDEYDKLLDDQADEADHAWDKYKKRLKESVKHMIPSWEDDYAFSVDHGADPGQMKKDILKAVEDTLVANGASGVAAANVAREISTEVGNRGDEDARSRFRSGRDLAEERPALQANLKSELLQRQFNGQGVADSMETVIAKLEKDLQVLHPNADAIDISALANKTVEDAQKELDKDLANPAHAAKEEDRMANRRSEVVGSTEMWAKIQSSIGGQDIPKQQLDVQKQMLAELQNRQDVKARLG